MSSHTQRTHFPMWGPTSDFPTWGSGKGTGNPQGIWLWRPVGFDYGTSPGLGETETLGGHTQNFVCTTTQGKKALTSVNTEPDLPGSVWGSSWNVCQQWPAVRTGALATAVLAAVCWRKSSWRSPVAHHRALRLQDWVATGQTTNREGAQPHPSADNWIKNLPMRARPSFLHSQSLPLGSLHNPLILILQWADRRSKNYHPTASRAKNHNHRKTNQNDHMDHSLV